MTEHPVKIHARKHRESKRKGADQLRAKFTYRKNLQVTLSKNKLTNVLFCFASQGKLDDEADMFYQMSAIKIEYAKQASSQKSERLRI